MNPPPAGQSPFGDSEPIPRTPWTAGLYGYYIGAVPILNRRHHALTRARLAGVFFLAVASVVLATCTHPVPEFNADRAFADLVRQTAFGTRVPGTEPHRACGEWLKKQLALGADSVWTQSFTAFVPLVGDSMPFTNIIAHFGFGKSDRVLLGAHWDTRPFADYDPDSANWRTPILGANDGASGVALLLEIARAISAQPPPVGVDIVFFDGEDLGRYGFDDEWSVGSRHYASSLQRKYKWVIIVDMVGDSDLTIYREGYSYRYAREFQDRVWEAAAAIGDSTTFRPEIEYDIMDDHMPFLMKGMPAVDLIDLRYPYWHTLGDTVDKCSPESLGRVGRVVLQVLYAG